MITEESEVIGHVSDVELHHLAVETEGSLTLLERGCGHFKIY